MSQIYDYIEEQEAGYERDIMLEDGWWWGMKNHLRRSFLYKNTQFTENNENRDHRPFRNIIKPILNIHYRTEGFDVKDIDIYVDNPKNYYKSRIIKKYHEKWALDNNIDTFIDELVESYVDYGGVLVKNVKGVRPEVVDLRTIAFCDQTDILSGPFAIKHYLNPQQIREMTNWDSEMVELAIEKAEQAKKRDKKDNQSETPGKYIEVYEVHGVFPKSMLSAEESDDEYVNQIHIVAFYKDDQRERKALTLFSSEEPKLPFKFLARDGGIEGRALGPGAVEELFEAQVWTNYAEIHIMEMLESASKTFYKTNDSRFKTKNNLRNAVNMQVFDLQEGKDITQIDNQPRNLTAFENSVQIWEDHANRVGSASEALQGQTPKSGTPFALFEAQIQEGKDMHSYRQGQIASFVNEIYREEIIPRIAKEITKGQTFLAELEADELIEISETIAQNTRNRILIERILSGQPVFREEADALKEFIRRDQLSRGTKRFMELLKDELSKDKLGINTNIAGKQKRLNQVAQKLSAFIRQVLATPQIKQDPELVALTNQLLEVAGVSPISHGLKVTSPVQPQAPGRNVEPLQAVGQANETQ